MSSLFLDYFIISFGRAVDPFAVTKNENVKKLQVNVSIGISSSFVMNFQTEAPFKPKIS